jgi:hypothetical protein
MSGGKRSKKNMTMRKRKNSNNVMAGGSWLAHVKKTYAALKKSRKGASLGDAMKAAKKTYKKGRE